MDGRGRLAEPVTDGAQAHPAAGEAPAKRRARSRRRRAPAFRMPAALRRAFVPLFKYRLPRGAGITAAGLLVVASISYGAVRGDHLPALVAELRDIRDATANSLGFRIDSI